MEQTVTNLIIFIIIISLFVGMVEVLVPINQKIDFDRTCDKYLKVASVKGGLTSSQISLLRSEISKIGTIKKCNISSGEYGDPIIMDIEIEINYNEMAFLTTEKSKRKLEYKKQTICLKLVN